MCFSANRDKLDWDRCKCDHMNGDPTDDRKENVAGLPPQTTKTTITTRGPVGLMLHEFSHACWHLNSSNRIWLVGDELNRGRDRSRVAIAWGVI
jgi:hypothetical protein